jgi:hypothetical protein
MRRIALAGLLALALVVPVVAQTYRDSSGQTVVPGVVPLAGCTAGGGCSRPASASNPLATQDQSTAASGVAQPTGGTGLAGWLSGIYKAVTGDATAPGTNSSAANQLTGTCSSSCNSTVLLGPVDTTGFQSIHLETLNWGGGSATAQVSDDQTCSTATNWTTVYGFYEGVGVADNGNAPTSILNFNNAGFFFPTRAHCFRLYVTGGYSSGTLTVEGYLRTEPTQNLLGQTQAFLGASPYTNDAIGHAATSALGTSLLAKSSAGNLWAVNCSAVAGATAGYCVVYNANSVPSTGALTGSQVLDFCYFGTSGQGCTISHNPFGAYYSSGIVVLVTTAASPYTYTTGTDTAAITVDYK